MFFNMKVAKEHAMQLMSDARRREFCAPQAALGALGGHTLSHGAGGSKQEAVQPEAGRFSTSGERPLTARKIRSPQAVTRELEAQVELLCCVVDYLRVGGKLESCVNLLCPLKGSTFFSLSSLREAAIKIYPGLSLPRGAAKGSAHEQTRALCDALQQHVEPYLVPLGDFLQACLSPKLADNQRLMLGRTEDGGYRVVKFERSLWKGGLCRGKMKNLAVWQALRNALSQARTQFVSPDQDEYPNGKVDLTVNQVLAETYLTTTSEEERAKPFLVRLRAEVLAGKTDAAVVGTMVRSFCREEAVSVRALVLVAVENCPGLRLDDSIGMTPQLFADAMLSYYAPAAELTSDAPVRAGPKALCVMLRDLILPGRDIPMQRDEIATVCRNMSENYCSSAGLDMASLVAKARECYPGLVLEHWPGMSPSEFSDALLNFLWPSSPTSTMPEEGLRTSGFAE